MSHLVQEYAKACGVKIGKPIICPTFYPIQFEKYITIHHGSCPATTYKYWDEVIEILRQELKRLNIKIVQIIDGENQQISLADKHISCSKKQAMFVIKNSECHIGVDSIYSNFAGEQSKPLIVLYSHTNPQNTQPWRINHRKTEYICSVGEEQKPSYDPNENPRTIDSIKPEKIAAAILKAVGSKHKIKFKTLFIGERYKDVCLDLIPTSSSNIFYDKINVRMDIDHNEEVLFKIIENNLVEITLAKPISDDILLTRKFSVINYIAEKFDKDFVIKVKNLGIHINLLCVSKETLAEQRFEFFEHNVIFHDTKKIREDNAKRLQDVFSKRIKTKSNKKITIGEKEYYSYIDALKSEDLFLLDLDWMYLYTDK